MAYFPSVRMSKIQLLKALVSERLSAAAEEIFRIVERTLVEYEEEVSHSKWVVDHRHRLLDVTQLHRTDSLQVTVTEVRVPSGHHQPSAKWNPSLDQQDAGSESTGGHGTLFAANLDSSPARSENSESDQEILTDIEDGDARQTRDPNSLLKILKVKKPYKCPVCMNSFSSKKTARRHIKIHSGDKSLSYQCQFCDRYFCHNSDLIVHTRIHTGEKPYKCKECHKCFAQRGNLLVHVRKHTGEKPYQCRECGQCFTKMVALNHHTEKHLGLVTLPGNGEQEPGTSRHEKLSLDLESSGIKTLALSLPPYDKSEFDQESLQPLCLYQIQTVDIDKDSSTILKVDQIKTEPAGEGCGVSESTTDCQSPIAGHPTPFVSQSEQGEIEEELGHRELLAELNHLNMRRILPKRRPGKAFEPSVEFEVGTVQKPYKCPHCGKCFSLTKTLIRHVKIHTEDKPYQCQFCKRNFCQKSDLVTHTRVHTGERPYQCRECHKSFAQKGNLVVHMRKHTGEKPYRCQECGSCFSQKASLDGHMQSHR